MSKNYVILASEYNWADEMDFSNAEIMTREEAERQLWVAGQVKSSFTLAAGSNEFIEVDGGEDVGLYIVELPQELEERTVNLLNKHLSSRLQDQALDSLWEMYSQEAPVAAALEILLQDEHPEGFLDAFDNLMAFFGEGGERQQLQAARNWSESNAREKELGAALFKYLNIEGVEDSDSVMWWDFHDRVNRTLA